MYIVVSNCLNESHVNKLYSFIHSFIDPAHVIYVAEGHNVGSEHRRLKGRYGSGIVTSPNSVNI